MVEKEYEKVSVVVPNYNYARYLGERINSILKQTYPIHELVILDDASTDDSDNVIREIIEKIKNERPEIKVVYEVNKQNSGNVFKQWQKGLDNASGEYVWICEADDLCNKKLLEWAMKGFIDKEVAISYVESCLINEKGKKTLSNLRGWVDMFDTKHWRKNYILDGKEEIKQVLCINNTIPNVSAVVFRKAKLGQSDKYLREAQKFELAGDWFFYVKVLMNGKVAYCKKSLNYHRMHSGGVTTKTNGVKHFEEIKKMQDLIASEVELGEEERNKIKKHREQMRKKLIG